MQNRFDDLVEDLKYEYYKLLKENNDLKNENAKLLSEHYKDEEIKRLEEEIENIETRCSNYGLFAKDYKKLMNWWEEHLEKDHVVELRHDSMAQAKRSMKPHYHIEVSEFAECTCYSIVCGKCKKFHSVYY